MPDEAKENIGVNLATELVKQLVEANKAAELTRDVLLDLRDLLAERVEIEKKVLEAHDELCGRIEVVSVAMNILCDVAGNGKKVSMADVAHAFVEAENEIFPDDDNDDNDDGEREEEPDPVGGGGNARRRDA